MLPTHLLPSSSSIIGFIVVITKGDDAVFCLKYAQAGTSTADDETPGCEIDNHW